jgi:phage tail tape-measure protein
MSVISFPRRIDTRPARPTARPAARERAAHRRGVTSIWRSASTVRKSALILSVAIAISVSGSMFVANRQMQIHQLQNQLLQDQSTYAVQIGSLTEKSAPSLIASQAGALHLVEPVIVMQVPSTSLDAILPLPKFSGYAPVTSRTIR